MESYEVSTIIKLCWFIILTYLYIRVLFSSKLEEKVWGRIIKFIIFLPFSCLVSFILLAITTIILSSIGSTLWRISGYTIEEYNFFTNMAYWYDNYMHYALSIVIIKIVVLGLIQSCITSFIITKKVIKKEHKTKKTFYIIALLLLISSLSASYLEGYLFGNFGNKDINVQDYYPEGGIRIRIEY